MSAKPAGELSIAKMGRDNIQLDKQTKAKFKQLAGDRPLVTYLRELADRELNSQPSKLQRFFQSIPRPPEGHRSVNPSIVEQFMVAISDEEIIRTFKDAFDAAYQAMKKQRQLNQPKLFNDKVLENGE